jgi:hypothetical protein
MTVVPKARNLLEATLNELSARRVAEKIAAEARAQQQQQVADQQPQLRQIDTRDQSGRVITTFEGRASWLRDFAPEPKRVVSIKTR